MKHPWSMDKINQRSLTHKTNPREVAGLVGKVKCNFDRNKIP